MNAIDRLMAIAEGEVGYREKRTNSRLDEKDANAGSGNYTKYNRDLRAWTGVGSLNAQWCQAFVDWCFIRAFGLEGAKRLIYVWTNYTPTGSGAFKNRGRYVPRGKGTPARGDVIYFYSASKGRIGHVGIVSGVSNGKVYTIEGNAGDGVKRKHYSLTSRYIDGYGRVDYTQAAQEDAAGGAVTVTGSSVRVRTGPGAEHPTLAIVHRGDRLPCLGSDGESGWYRVTCGGAEGFISGRYARLEEGGEADE